MLSPTSTICLVPQVIWNDPGTSLPSLVSEALEIERRFVKGVNLERERVRYSICCSRIEDVVLDAAGTTAESGAAVAKLGLNSVVAVRLSDGYVGLVERRGRAPETPLAGSDGRLGCSFIPPCDVRAHRDALTVAAAQFEYDGDLAPRLQLLEFAEEGGAAIVECLNAYDRAGVPVREITPRAPAHVPDDSATASLAVEDDVMRLPPQMKAELQELRRVIAAALTGRGTANLSNGRPVAITEALRSFVYAAPDTLPRGTSVRLVYSDGSEAAPLLLQALARTPAQIADIEGWLPLRLSLMSMRHLDLDRLVDMAWYRNRMLSQQRPHAETDALAYSWASTYLERLVERQPHLQLYLTGLPPAVVGFLRALTETLARHPGRIAMTPVFLIGSSYLKGRLWI